MRIERVLTFLILITLIAKYEDSYTQTYTVIKEDGTSAPDAKANHVLENTEYWTTNGTLIEGSIINRGSFDADNSFPGKGYYTSIVDLPDASEICSGTTLLGIVGTANCGSADFDTGTGDTDAAAAQIPAGYEAWDDSGNLIDGTMTDQGSWNLTNAFPGAGYISGSSNAPTASTICTGTTILGVAGTASCGGGVVFDAGTVDTDAAGAQILSGYEAWDDSGNLLDGSMASQGSWDLDTTFPGAGYYSGATNTTPTASNICTGQTILGVSGTAVCGGNLTVVSNFAGLPASPSDGDYALTEDGGRVYKYIGSVNSKTVNMWIPEPFASNLTDIIEDSSGNSAYIDWDRGDRTTDVDEARGWSRQVGSGGSIADATNGIRLTSSSSNYRDLSFLATSTDIKIFVVAEIEVVSATSNFDAALVDISGFSSANRVVKLSLAKGSTTKVQLVKTSTVSVGDNGFDKGTSFQRVYLYGDGTSTSEELVGFTFEGGNGHEQTQATNGSFGTNSDNYLRVRSYNTSVIDIKKLYFFEHN